ncbi:MAG TPA: 50S ribosomal protein L13, partial [Candidatus Nitrosopolaris sp.]|nr:50S ribosomal protein L13 [Candidatus Nitrosopolaris sp.]
MADQTEVRRPEQRSKIEVSRNNGGEMVIVNAAECIAGRMCSKVSKLLLQGTRVTIVNAEKAVLSGHRHMLIEAYKKKLEISSATNPIHGPFHPRRPDTMVTRLVRGMLPKRKSSGLEAFRRLRVYIGVPERLGTSKLLSFDDSKITKPASYY